MQSVGCQGQTLLYPCAYVVLAQRTHQYRHDIEMDPFELI